MRNERFALRGLYAITPESADTHHLVQSVEQCVAGGARLVQYRAKSLAPALALAQARLIGERCRRGRVPLIVNDSLELAVASGADGVHLGRDDGDVRRARERFPDGIIGVSCYANAACAARARDDGADYVAIGSVFASATKPAAPLAPLAAIAEAKRAGGLPVCAIGGIDAANAPQAIAAGADMVAVISALFTATDVRAAAAALSALFDTTLIG
jgi:thiamine-phosphate pyrophosphorylase